MGRTLTGTSERAVERAADAIHDWANDVIDHLYESDAQHRVAPQRWAERLPALVEAFQKAAAAYRRE